MDIRHSLKPALGQLGIDKLRKHQQKPVDALLDGQDTVIIAATSFGKTAIYQLPALVHGGLTLVIEPTLALIYNQVRRLQSRGIPADYLAPEQLKNERVADTLAAAELVRVVVDKAHVLSQTKDDFRKAYGQIGKFVQKLPPRLQLMALTATATSHDLKVIRKSLRMKKLVSFYTPMRRENLKLFIWQRVFDFFEGEKWKSQCVRHI